MSTEAVVVVVLVAIAPLCVVLVVAILRGYTITLHRNGRGKHDGNGTDVPG